MTSAAAIMNPPIEVTIGGRKLKVRKLPLESMFAALEGEVISRKIENGRVASSQLSLSGKDKIDFLIGVTSNLPQGGELHDLAENLMECVYGIRFIIHMAVLKDQPELTMEDMTGLITEDSVDDMTSIVEYVFDMGDGNLPSNEDKDGDSDKKEESAEGNDEGTEEPVAQA